MNGFMIMWLIFAVLFLILELSTVSLVSIWFVAGAILALLAAAIDLSIGIQIGVFIIGTAALLIFTKPVAQKMLREKVHATNFDRIIGKDGVVIEKINPDEGKGQIKILGSIWSAKTEDGSEIEKGTRVEVLRIEGVKAVVKVKEGE